MDVTQIRPSVQASSFFSVAATYGWHDISRSKNRYLVRDTNGRLWCTYQTVPGTYTQQIYVAYSDDNGSSWTSEAVTNTTDRATNSPDQFESVIAVDTSNNLHVVWSARGDVPYNYWRQIQYKKRNSDGTWDAQEAITADANNFIQASPSIDIDSSDQIHVVWTASYIIAPLTDYKICYRRRTASGWDAVEAVASIATYTQDYPNICIDTGDDIHVIWHGKGWGTNTTNWNLQYRSKLSGSWQSQEAITDVAYDQYPQSFAIDTSGEIHLSWAGEGWGSNTGNRNLQYRSRTGAGWGTQVAITDVANDQGPPAVAVDASGNVTIAWIGGGWGANPFQDNLQYIRNVGGTWQSQVDHVNRSGSDQAMPSLLHSFFPVVSGTRYGIPLTGFAMVFSGQTASGTVYQIEYSTVGLTLP